jgi:hypothetical protein
VRRLVLLLCAAGALVVGAVAAAETINGVIDGSESTRANVPFDNDIPSACPVAKTYPGNLAQAGTHYDAYARTNSGTAQCLTVSLQLAAGGATDCTVNPSAKCGFSEVYTTLNTADAGDGYRGDIGTPVAPGQTRSFSVNVGAGAAYTVVVDEYNPGAGTTNYTLTISGSPTAVALRSLEAVRVHDGVAVRWSVGSAPRTLGFDVYRRAAGHRSRVNTRPIASRSATAPSSYALVDRLAPRSGRVSYEIEAIGLDGRRTLLGVAGLAG